MFLDRLIEVVVCVVHLLHHREGGEGHTITSGSPEEDGSQEDHIRVMAIVVKEEGQHIVVVVAGTSSEGGHTS